MRVLVIGGTGTLGRQIARRALDAGHQVRCMVRTPRKAAFLQEWGCELTRGDLLEPDSLDYALEGQEAVIDAAGTRATEGGSVYDTDWTGKLNLFNACQRAGVKRVVFISLLDADKHRDVPLMDIKYCTEQLLIDSDFDYTILRCVAFMQGVIGQVAIPVLESQTVWVSGTPTSIAYMNTQDVARFAVAALQRPETVRQAFPVVGPRAWNTGEITQLCEKYSGKSARVFRVRPVLLRAMQAVASFFEPAVNVVERLAFDKVTGGGVSLDAPMEASYAVFGLDPAETTQLDDYLKEYYDTILRRLRELEADLDKDAKKKLPF
ncbi:NAD(P)H-binding protein [Vulcanococcus limneticus Candia 3F8]|uniref:NAD(P)H-binding protein n=1 Tax=Vulcanococcus limneticus TaxID=2170428 RepID=UPI000B97DB7F|nr:NAD(P)H-binding protein [Vulcanococcus limneticus]MCP9791096.1 NAD(P)H-binding protein [Vulcanococcus limneticus MW73D5]MCP9892320.1 NAD(P)H-binding protein [Vulcanococcus limneticus Candia 3F8]MCP9895858.1 NAD(P)H-binding protein [Vulcanococcus limneticus Candia 3B3]